MSSSMFRLLISVAIILYALGIIPGNLPQPSPPYRGPYTALHSASRSMDRGDREALSEAFASGSRMLSNDKMDLIDKTDEAQRFVWGILEFDYQSIGQPKSSYPNVADAIEDIVSKQVGSESKSFSAADKRKLADALDDISEAIK